MGEHADEVRHRLLQLHLEGVIVHRLHAQGVGRLLARDDVGGIDDGRDLHVPGVRRGRLGIHRALEGKDEVMSGDGIPVGPLGILAQVEHVMFVVLGFPGLGDARQGFTLGAGGDETFEQVTQYVGFGGTFHFLGIQGGGFGTIAFHQGLLGSKLGTGGDIGGVSQGGATEKCSQ